MRENKNIVKLGGTHFRAKKSKSQCCIVSCHTIALGMKTRDMLDNAEDTKLIILLNSPIIQQREVWELISVKRQMEQSGDEE